MPYITKEQRRGLTPTPWSPTDAGELTFQLTLVIEDYRAMHPVGFRTFAEIIGALEQTKDEFQRRVIHPYEDRKRELHGDVYAPSV